MRGRPLFRPGARAIAAVAALGLALALPPAAEAQSLLGAGGLGIPLTPLDGRGRAMGSVGIGLFGPSLSPTDPAAAVEYGVPTASLTFQPSWVDAESADGTADGSGTRFPLIGVAYPVGEAAVATLTVGSVLDQRWDVEIPRAIDLGGETEVATDNFTSDGGVSAARLGFARRITSGLAVGVTAGRYIGEVERVFTRRFDSLAVGDEVPTFRTSGRWSYSATTLAGGARLDLGDFLRVAGSITWTSTLEADADEDTRGGDDDFEIPLEVRAGASGVLAPGLNLNVGLSWADWSDTGDGELAGGGGTSILGLGAGIEYADFRLFGWPAPLRAGFRRDEYPFRFDGEGPTETAFSAGLGLNLVQSQGIDAAKADFAIERGERSASSLSENFWRATITVQLAGF